MPSYQLLWKVVVFMPLNTVYLSDWLGTENRRSDKQNLKNRIVIDFPRQTWEPSAWKAAAGGGGTWEGGIVVGGKKPLPFMSGGRRRKTTGETVSLPRPSFESVTLAAVRHFLTQDR